MNIQPIIKFVLVAILIAAWYGLQIEYYQLIRFASMTLFALIGYLEFKDSKEALGILWFCFALLFNPFLKINLSGDIWEIIDIIVIAILILSLLRKDTYHFFLNLKLNKSDIYKLVLFIFISTFIIAAVLVYRSSTDYFLNLGYDEVSAQRFNDLYDDDRVVYVIITLASFWVVFLLIYYRKKILHRQENNKTLDKKIQDRLPIIPLIPFGTLTPSAREILSYEFNIQCDPDNETVSFDRKLVFPSETYEINLPLEYSDYLILQHAIRSGQLIYDALPKKIHRAYFKYFFKGIIILPLSIDVYKDLYRACLSGEIKLSELPEDLQTAYREFSN